MAAPRTFYDPRVPLTLSCGIFNAACENYRGMHAGPCRPFVKHPSSKRFSDTAWKKEQNGHAGLEGDNFEKMAKRWSIDTLRVGDISEEVGMIFVIVFCLINVYSTRSKYLSNLNNFLIFYQFVAIVEIYFPISKLQILQLRIFIN